MDKINSDFFKQLMSLDGKYAATAVEFVSGGNVLRIEKTEDASFGLDEDGRAVWEDNYSYDLYKNGKAEKRHCTCGDITDYVLENYSEDGTINISSINDEFGTAEQFKQDIEFQGYGMARLLDMYSDCDEFSLTAYYNEVDERHPHGIYKLDKELGENALKLIKFQQRDICHLAYGGTVNGQKVPFDRIYAEITAEAEQIYASTKERPVSLFDMCMYGQTKYDDKLMIMYHAAGYVQDCIEDINAQYLNTEERPIDGEFDSAPLAALKPYINRVLVTYCWHSPISDRLGKVFFIKLNEETKKWLLQYKDDYAVSDSGLFDLAFYKHGGYQFSSCTTEHRHIDYTRYNDGSDKSN